MNLIRIARPYAKAIFDIAKQTGEVESIYNVLFILSKVSEDQQIKAVIKHPEILPENKAALFSAIMKKIKQQNEMVVNLISILALRDRLMVIPQICVLFEQYMYEYQSIIKVEVCSYKTLAQDVLTQLKSAFEKKFAKQIVLNQTTDSSLLGGVKITAGDTVIDSSIRGRLEKLSSALLA